MLDFLDHESLRVGNVLSRDSGDSKKRKIDEEEGLHGFGLGEGIQYQGTQQLPKIAKLQR